MLTKNSATFLLILPFVFSGGGDDNDPGESALTPPVMSPAQGASGKVEVEKSGTKQEFNVTGKALPKSMPPGPFEVWLEDASHALFKVGDMQQTGNSGQWRLHLETNNNSAPAALGTADVADLTNRIIQVRESGGVSIYLAGTVPAPSVGAGGGNSNNNGPVQIGVVALQRPASNPPDGDASGKVKLTIHGDESEFEAEGEHLDTDGGAAFSVHIETSAGSNAYYLVGPMALGDGKNPHWELELESKGSPPAPLAVASLTDLAGRNLQIRDKNDATVLQGILPAVTNGIGKNNFNDQNNLTVPAASQPSPKARGKVRSKFNAPKGASTLEIQASNLAGSNTYDVFMETAAASGVFSKIGSLQLKGKKTLSGRFRVETKKGESLPFGAASLLELTNRGIEIRDGNGNAHLAGTAP